MKFNKAINRDVEISGNDFVVGLDQTGITFRLKGKRKVVQVDWQTVLDSARGENGEGASEHLGLAKLAPKELPHEAPRESLPESEPQSGTDAPTQAFGVSAGAQTGDD